MISGFINITALFHFIPAFTMITSGELKAYLKAAMTRFIKHIFRKYQRNVSRSVEWIQLVFLINLPDIQIKCRVSPNKGQMLCLSV